MWSANKRAQGSVRPTSQRFLLSAAMALFVPGIAQPQEVADKEAFEAVCGACHPSTMVNDLRTEPEWKETVAAMVSIGAKGTDEQFAGIMRYVARTLTRVNVNTATASQLAPVLDVSPAIAQAMVRYREDHGNFKTLDELKKVPGVDGARLDTRKDRIVF